jgi:hypothetical protein
VGASLAALGAFLALGGASSEQSGPPKAAIVDQLSLTSPNPAFVENATRTLEQAGYKVTYSPGEEVTLDLYRRLPSLAYKVIVLRVHSGVELGQPSQDVALFSAEPYSPTRYVEEQRTGRVALVYYYEGSPQYFGVTPDFVKASMVAKFDGTTIILMGCDGLRNDATARAFVGKGAKSFVSWSGPVSASHTDTATERLLQHLVIDGLSTREAVAETMAEVGPDPSFGSQLRYYPAEAAASAAH